MAKTVSKCLAPSSCVAEDGLCLNCLASTSCHAVCGAQDGLCLVWLTVLVMLQVVFKMVCVLSGSHFL